jgi:hypothetical protein
MPPDVSALFVWAPLAQPKTVHYRRPDGTPFAVEFDPTTPCIVCGLAVVEASMAGTAICPWCDCGTNRDGSRKGVAVQAG